MTESINMLAVRAAGIPECREQLIAENEQVILRTASRLCRRYITRSDDEWSVSLSAFSRAVDVYSSSRGDFLPFAQMLIKRSLTDYYRSQAGTRREICVSPCVFDGSRETETDAADPAFGEEASIIKEGVRASVEKSAAQAADSALRMEVLAANDMLGEYGFRFFDLTSCSPKQDRSRQDCAAAVRAALRNRALCGKLKKTHRLPIRELCRESGISRKTLDRYRKYIIMAILILDEDYPMLSGYLRYIHDD